MMFLWWLEELWLKYASTRMKEILNATNVVFSAILIAMNVVFSAILIAMNVVFSAILIAMNVVFSEKKK